MLSLNLSNKAIQDFFFLPEIVREEKGIKKKVSQGPLQEAFNFYQNAVPLFRKVHWNTKCYWLCAFP